MSLEINRFLHASNFETCLTQEEKAGGKTAYFSPESNSSLFERKVKAGKENSDECFDGICSTQTGFKNDIEKAQE